MAAFNPGKYVFQPRPLQQFDFGAGFLDLANARAENRRLAEQKRSAEATLSQRQSEQRDTNSLNAATFARDDANTQLKTATDRYAQRAKLADAGRTAIQSGDQAGWAALEPSLREAGIKVTYDALGNPSIENGEAPTRAPLNIQGARSTIYGGGAPTMGQPLQVPGFGADGQRNPMDRLPGASAAALGRQPVPPPPAPGSAEADLATVTAMSSPDEEETAPATLPTQGATPTEAQPNPFNTPGYSPYRIDMEAVRNRNRAQLDPIMQGVRRAAPSNSPINIGQLNEGIRASGMSPDKAMEGYYKPLLTELTHMANGQQAAEAAQGRLKLGAQNQANMREDKLRREAQSKAKAIVTDDQLKKTKEKMHAADGAYDLLGIATRNSPAANAFIENIYRMNNTGVMTDKDFDRATEGVKGIWQMVKDKTLNAFFQDHGFNPGIKRQFKEFLDVATQSHRKTMKAAASKMEAMYRSAKTEGERYEYEDGFREFFDPEYYPRELQQPYEGPIPKGAVVEEEEAPAPPEAGDSLGQAPLPKSLDGGQGPVKVSPNGTRFEPNPTLGRKPPRKKSPGARALSGLTDDQIQGLSAEEAKEMAKEFD